MNVSEHKESPGGSERRRGADRALPGRSAAVIALDARVRAHVGRVQNGNGLDLVRSAVRAGVRPSGLSACAFRSAQLAFIEAERRFCRLCLAASTTRSIARSSAICRMAVSTREPSTRFATIGRETGRPSRLDRC